MLTYAHIKRITIITGENGMKTKDLMKLLFGRNRGYHNAYNSKKRLCPE